MNKPDKFTLITGIIGLFADILGIYVIFDSYRSQNITNHLNSNLLHLLIFLFYVYGWFIISWVYARKKIRKENIANEPEGMFIFLYGTGILLVPLVGVWLYLLLGDSISTIFLLNAFLAAVLSVILNLIVGVGILFSVLSLVSTLGND